MRLNKTHRNKGFVCAGFHLALVFCIYLVNVANGVSYATILWFFLAIIDFPVSLGIRWEELHIAGNYKWNNELMPLLYFGLVGTLWWFFLGTFLAALLSLLKTALPKRQG